MIRRQIIALLSILGLIVSLLLFGEWDRQKRKSTIDDAALNFGKKMTESLDLSVKMNGLPLQGGELISVDGDQLIMRFPRRKSVPSDIFKP